jgi:hypothetical protein
MLRSPRLVCVGEPDPLGVERADHPPAFRAQLVEFGKEDRHVAADHDRTPALLGDHYLPTASVARAGTNRIPCSSSNSAVDGYALAASLRRLQTPMSKSLAAVRRRFDQQLPRNQ